MVRKRQDNFVAETCRERPDCYKVVRLVRK